MDLPNLSCSFLTGSRPEKEGQRSTPTGISHFSWCALSDKTVEEVSILYARSSSSGKRWKSLDIGGWGSSLYPPDFDAWQDRQGRHLSQQHKFSDLPHDAIFSIAAICQRRSNNGTAFFFGVVSGNPVSGVRAVAPRRCYWAACCWRAVSYSRSHSYWIQNLIFQTQSPGVQC